MPKQDHQEELRDTLTVAASDDHDQRRHEFLFNAHLPILRLVILAVSPSLLLIYLFLSWKDPCWQFFAMLGMVVVLTISWLCALAVFKKGYLETSVTLFVVTTVLFSTGSCILMPEVISLVIIADLGVIVYGTLFSRMQMYIGAISALISFAFCELFIFLQPFDVKDLRPVERFVIVVGLGLVLIPIIALFLRRSQNTNETFFFTMNRKNREQARIISTVDNIQPVINRALEQIRKVSDQFASQASEQASAVTEVNATIAEVSQTAEQTAQTAIDSQQSAATTSKNTLKSSHQLKTVEQGFTAVVEIIEAARGEVGELAKHVDRIEQILGFNLEIGGQIKILAINAGIQAAKAGQYGGGFRVVASELRKMIHDTEENLDSSSRLLDEIRQQTQASADKIQEGSERLSSYYRELRTMSTLIEQGAQNIKQTSDRVATIAGTAREQQIGMREVGIAMEELDIASAQLSESATVLLESVDTIGESHAELTSALDF